MSSQRSKIVVIGTGEWSAKVSRILLNQSPNTLVEIIGAQRFLASHDHAPEYVDVFNDIEFIWIATKPVLQIAILEKLQAVKTKIILEKPLAQSYPDLIKIEKAISNSSSEIYLSQPWTYSDIWRKSLEILTQRRSVNRILIIRGDSKVRSDVASGIDWIPHDLYLAASIAQKFGVSDSNIDVQVSTYLPKRILMNVKIGNGLSLEINSGFFPTRIAEASSFANQDLVMTSNFLTGEIVCLDGRGSTSAFYPTDTSIMNMINHFRANPSVMNWTLIFKFYSSILN